MTREHNRTPIRTHQLRQIDVVDDADWLKDYERVLMHEGTVEECLVVLMPKEYTL